MNAPDLRKHPLPVSHSPSRDFPWAIMCLACSGLTGLLVFLLDRL